MSCSRSSNLNGFPTTPMEPDSESSPSVPVNPGLAERVERILLLLGVQRLFHTRNCFLKKG